MKPYPPIADHGLIGDLQTAALVSTDGTVDWFCCPRFDSPSVFGSILDAEHGGCLRLCPGEPVHTTKQMYFPDTAILITRFMTDTGVGEVVDFMPITGTTATPTHRLVRMVRCVRGEMTFQLEIKPRFDYGRQPHEIHLSEFGAQFDSADLRLAVHVVQEPRDERVANVQVVDNDLHVTVALKAGMVRGLVLESTPDGPPREIRVGEVERLFEETALFWRTWVGQSTYTGRWRETLERSAITLKLMTYAPSGGLVAAPTAGLPEQIGGERNWDYRFTWIRDASFSIYSLLGLGFAEEAVAFAAWVRDRINEAAGTEGGPLNVMYRIDGSCDLTEETLEHWQGYRGSAPVRIGNGASGQLQLDIYGEALDSLFFGVQRGLEVGHDGWTAVCRLLEWLSTNWDQPEEGIWETRGGRKNFTYGRLMSWVAFDRGIRLAATLGRPAPIDEWVKHRDAIYEQIMDRGWNPDRKAFVQQYGERVLDSSLLRMSRVGFIASTDPLWASTLVAMDSELVTDSLVQRYDAGASPDGLSGEEGTFSLCTFLYVDALAQAGRLDDARLVFEKMLTFANHVGLYSEEIALNGEQIGNFPQAFTHLALIDAAIRLDAQLDARRADTSSAGPVSVPATLLQPR
jgi:GH15 family glucan-1,4-alpha-glucosidase